MRLQTAIKEFVQSLQTTKQETIVDFKRFMGIPEPKKSAKWPYFIAGLAGFAVISQLPKLANYRRKVLAPRTQNGGRFKIVLIIGNLNNPFTQNLARKLDIAGFIVYITSPGNQVFDFDENIRPLIINDLRSASETQTAINQFKTDIATPVRTFNNSHPHNLQLAGCVFVSNLRASGPLETIDQRLMNQCLIENLEFPLSLLTLGLMEVIRTSKCKVIFSDSKNNSTVNMGVNAFRKSLAQNLETELADLDVDVDSIQHIQLERGNNSLAWMDKFREVYDGIKQTTGFEIQGVSGEQKADLVNDTAIYRITKSLV